LLKWTWGNVFGFGLLIGAGTALVQFSTTPSTTPVLSSAERCYYAITGEHSATTVTNNDACFAAFAQIHTATNPTLRQSILRNFQALHTSWFRNQIVRDFNELPLLPFLEQSYSVEHSGAFFTLALSKKEFRFDNIFMGLKEWGPQASPSLRSPATAVTRQWRRIEDVALRSPATEQTDYKSQQPHNNAGILSSSTYLFMNLDGELDFVADGGWKTHRLFSKSIFADFLCVERLPRLENADVAHFVDGKAEMTFMHNSKCIKCHATMERMAAGVRDFHFKKENVSGHPSVVLESLGKSVAPGTLWPQAPGKDYATLKPSGKIYIRDPKNQLIEHDFEGLNGLSDYLAKNDDMYRCVVKRYFEFFASRGGREDFEPQIEKIKNNLKESQDLFATVKDILAFSFAERREQ